MIRILIVDDQKSVRENIKLMLSAEPRLEIVGTAENGYKGMEMAEELNPDIILMDLEMPKLDGLTATKLISQKNPALNIIILTIKDQNELLLQSLNAGARGYLLKNSDVREIVNTIDLVYEGNKQTNHQNGKSNTLKNISSNGRSYSAIPKLTASNLTSEPVSQSSLQSFSSILEPTLSWEALGDRVPSQSKSNFSVFLSILKRRYVPASIGFLSVLLGAIVYLTFAKRTYQATASLILQNRQESISELGKDLSNIQESNEYSALASQIESIKSRSVIRNALESVDLPEVFSDGISLQTIEYVQSKLAVSVIPNTNIIEVSYVDEDPKFAADLLNEVVIAVRKKNTENIREEASSVRKFLEQEVVKQKDEVAQIKAAENSYRQEQGIVSLDNQTSNLVNNLSELEAQNQELSTQIKEQESKVNNLKGIANVDNAQSAYVEGQVGQDRQLEELRQRLTDIDARLAAARANFTDNNPAVIDLKEEKANTLALYEQQIDRLVDGGATSPSQTANSAGSQTENGIGEQVIKDLITNQVQLDADRQKLQAVRTEIDKIKKQIALLPSKVQSLTDLVSQQEQANESLNFLQRKLEEAKIAEAQLISNLQIAEQATVPMYPYAPNVPAVLAVAMFMATILMTAIVLLLEKIDRTLYDGAEVEQDLNIPFLTSLPNLADYEQNPSHVASFLNDKALYEPYRFLLKRLESYGRNSYKAIVVTSAITGEGKSTVASHLGMVSAMLSKRTLIIDAHLHAPRQHELLKANLQPGLKELITGSLNWSEAVQPTKIENLSLLASGDSGADSWMILESPRMRRILQEASLEYDLIIIDTPPVNNSCDAYTLSNYGSGMMMVTRPFHTSKDVLEQTVLDLRRNNASIIGFVINNTDKPKPEPNLDSIALENSDRVPALYSSKPTKNSRNSNQEVRQP